MTKKSEERKNKEAPPSASEQLLDAPKGHLDYTPGQAFLLHVFWEAPSSTAAQQLLDALQKCAVPTHRDTPCTPTYFFRVSGIDEDVCAPVPKKVGEHVHLQAGRRRVDEGGVEKRADVEQDLVKRGLPPGLVEQTPTLDLPQTLQHQPVLLEFTELYMDERAFNDHAASRDFLDAHEDVMKPAFIYRSSKTVRLGIPPESIVGKKSEEPVLHEAAVPMGEGSVLFQAPPREHTEGTAAAESTAPHTRDAGYGGGGAHHAGGSGGGGGGGDTDEGSASGGTTEGGDTDIKTQKDGGDIGRKDAVFISVDVEGTGVSIDDSLRSGCTTCVSFPHPLRQDVTRVMCVTPSMPSKDVLSAIAALNPLRGEAHTHTTTDAPDDTDSTPHPLRDALDAAGLSSIAVNATPCAGYVLHERAPEVVCRTTARVE